MSNGDLNKKIEFIVEQQAQFAADIQVMREIHAADTALLKEQHRNLSDAVTTIVGLVGGLAQSQAATDVRIAKLADLQTATDARLAELAELVNIFIGVVERYIGGNGGAQPQAT